MSKSKTTPDVLGDPLAGVDKPAAPPVEDAAPAVERVKTTVYMDPDLVYRLDVAQARMRHESGGLRLTRSELLDAAILIALAQWDESGIDSSWAEIVLKLRQD